MATIDWTAVEQAEKKRTPEGYQVALLESDKLLGRRLAEEKVSGQNVPDRLRRMELYLTKPKELRAAAAYVAGLRSGETPALDEDHAKRFLQSYRQGIADINEYGRERLTWQSRLKVGLGVLKAGQQQALKVTGLVLLGCLIILILADTGAGQFMVDGVVDIVRSIVQVVVAVAVVIGLLAAIVVGTAISLNRQRTGKVTAEDEDESN